MEVKRPAIDPVVEAYKAGVDMSLIEENLRLTPDERLARLQAAVNSVEELKRARATVRRRDDT